MLERGASIFLVGVPGTLQTDDSAHQILGGADFRAAHQRHGGVTRQPAKHDNFLVPNGHRN